MKKILFIFFILISVSAFANGIKVNVKNNVILDYSTNDTISNIDTTSIKDGIYIYKDSCLFNLLGKQVYPKINIDNDCLTYPNIF